MAQIQGVGADYVYLNCGPLFHVATFMTTLATFLVGGNNVFTPRVDAEELCRLIAEERCTGGFIMPPTMDQIVELNADGRFDLKTLRGFPGKPEWTAMITVDESPWGKRPAGYGQTEVMGLATFNALQPSIGSSGRPAPFVRITTLDPDGSRARPGRDGGDRRAGAHGDERLLQPPRAQRAAPGRRLAPHQRPRPRRGRRVAHLHRPQDPAHQVGGREHLPHRGGGLSQAAPGRRRRGGDRRARPHLGPERHRRGGAARGRRRRAPRRSSSTAGSGSPRTRSPSRSSSPTPFPATASPSTTTRLDASYGGGGYPGAGH